MPVRIRLKRFGRRNKPFYRIVIADSREPRQGKSVDDIGYYNPLVEPAEFQINEEKALAWLREGAKPTDTVKNLLSKSGILKKLNEQIQTMNEAQDMERSDSEQEV